MNPPRISVLLPTYNRRHIIEEAINAVLNQDFIDWELIILDDGSTDDTTTISQKYIKNHEKIQYHRNEVNHGLPANRNIGISLAKGELIFFIEDDLILDKECLKILLQTYDDLKIECRVGGLMPRLIDDSETRPKLDNCEPMSFNRFTGEIDNNYWIECPKVQEVITTHACSMYPKKILNEVGGYAENVYIGNYFREETDLNFRILQNGYHFYYQSKAWAFHSVQKSGGCRNYSFIISESFKIRNHFLFLIRIFRIKALYMIPLFLLDYAGKTIIYIISGKMWK